MSERILLLVTPIPREKDSTQSEATSVYCSFENSLLAFDTTPTARDLCEHCRTYSEELEDKIKDMYAGINSRTSVYNVNTRNTNNVLNDIAKNKLRILLYPGNRVDIEDLNVHEATHNMIIQFDKSAPNFKATEPHKHTPPSFYQVCNSVEIAIRHIEALLTDAGMCHYMCISDAAKHHDEKQNISKMKVEFLRDVHDNLVDICDISVDAKRLIDTVCAQLNDDTPYISFLSIFTIASDDIHNIEFNINKFFTDYYLLWEAFRKWYYQKKGLLFSDNVDIVEPEKKIFDRNVYQGQISPESAVEEIKKTLKNLKEKKELEEQEEIKRVLENLKDKNEIKKRTERLKKKINSRGKKVHLFAFVILRNVPSGKLLEICKSLFPGQIHQATWTITAWEDLKKFDLIKDYIEVDPFLLEV